MSFLLISLAVKNNSRHNKHPRPSEQARISIILAVKAATKD
jgi:hypothetical protein